MSLMSSEELTSCLLIQTHFLPLPPEWIVLVSVKNKQETTKSSEKSERDKKNKTVEVSMKRQGRQETKDERGTRKIRQKW